MQTAVLRPLDSNKKEASGTVSESFKDPPHKSFSLWRSLFFCLHTSWLGLLFLHRRLGQNQIACLRHEARVPWGPGEKPCRLCFLVMWPWVSQETRNLNCSLPPPHPISLTFCWKYISCRDGGWNGGQVWQRSASFISPKVFAKHRSAASVQQLGVVKKQFHPKSNGGCEISGSADKKTLGTDKINDQIWFYREYSNQNWNESQIYNTGTLCK